MAASIPKEDDQVKIVAPDYALKKIIGEDVDIREVFSPERVAQAQGAIEAHKDDFLVWVKADLSALEESYASAQADPANSEAAIKKLAHTAFVIKSQAGTFGFTLATAIAKSLDDFCGNGFRPVPEHLTVVRKHIDALQSVFAAHLTGDGGKTGLELIGNLQKLVAKYRDKP